MSTLDRPLAAALWMTGSIAAFSSLAIAGRAIGTALDSFEVMLYRSLIGIAVVTATAFLTGRQAEITARRLDLHILRNILHFIGQNLWLVALGLIPLAQLFALEFSYPIIVAVTAPLLLGERLAPRNIMAAAIGFAGVLLVARPFGGELSPGLLAGLFCAVGFAGSAIVTKRLTRQATITCILFWLAVIQTALGLVCAAWDGSVALPTMAVLPWVGVMGLAGLGGHFCLTKALSLAPASIVTPVDFLRLPLIAVLGMLFYNEPLDLAVLIGGALILGGNLMNIRARAPQPQAD